MQAQFRMPFRAHLRSRKSLLIGVTRLTSRKRHPYDSGFWGDDDRVVFPHAGVSLQWPMGRHADFRFDAQGLFTLDGELPLVPRAVADLRLAPVSAALPTLELVGTPAVAAAGEDGLLRVGADLAAAAAVAKPAVSSAGAGPPPAHLSSASR